MKTAFTQLAEMVREKRLKATGGKQMEYRLEDHGGDLTITGVGMTAEAAEEIKRQLPEDTRSRVIGWRRAGAMKCGKCGGLAVKHYEADGAQAVRCLLCGHRVYQKTDCWALYERQRQAPIDGKSR